MTVNPIDYVGTRLARKHVAVLYEDTRYAQLIEFSYLLRGIERNQHCVYFTFNEKQGAKKLMTERGLDATRFENEKRLHTVNIANANFDFWNAIE
ncbi:MAG: hypothetical protein ACREBQ_00505, partial [Nitrososphaerales archaeon]